MLKYKDISCCSTSSKSRVSTISLIPNDSVYHNNCPGNSRTRASVIKSGQQPNKRPYSYSYREHLKHKKFSTYEQKLPKDKPYVNNTTLTSSIAGNCESTCNRTHYNPSNKKFMKQGAVSSSSRLERLKYDSITNSNKCANDPNKCTGVYVGDKQRFTGDYNESGDVDCPQYTARHRAIGAYPYNRKCYKL
jgi:hypothetical protein